jgi:Pyridoxamine 5'-phosphate oxidase
MSDLTPSETKNLCRCGSDALEWSRAYEQLAARSEGPGRTWFLGTVRPDGRPHPAGIGPAWSDGALYLTAYPDTRKARNLAQNPACTMSVRLDGIDVVLEGEAIRTADPETLERLAAVFRDGGWPAEVDGEALTAPFSAPSAGPPPWELYRFTIDTAFGVATAEPHGATRWRFDSR